jgi:branched-chain amino acid transport system permease protein
MGHDVASILFGTLLNGSLYALLGTGFVVLFRCTGAINFAQGALMALSGFLYVTLVNRSLSWPWAMLFTLAASFAIGALLYLIIFRRLVGASLFSLVIATLGLQTTLTVVMNIVWGPNSRNVATPFSRGAVLRLSGQPLTHLDLFVIVSAVVFVGLTLALFQGTRVGTRMRAVANNPLLAGLGRVNVHAISALAWGLSVLLTAVAGISFGLLTSVDSVAPQGFGLVAFAAVLVGGLDSLRGAVLGSYLLAFAQAVITVFIGAEWAEVLAYVILVLVLFARPQGLLGTPAVVRV